MDTLTKKKLNKKNVVLKDLNLAYESYDLIMILVSHQEFKIFSKNYKFEKLLKSNGYIYDFKNILREHKKIIKV
jgi:UDP-N-acetyl-D-mannosaminuronate dehydrogenase